MHQEVILETHRVDEDDLVCGSRTEKENSERIELKRKMVEVCYIIIAYCDRFSFQRSGRAALSLSLSVLFEALLPGPTRTTHVHSRQDKCDDSVCDVIRH